jgi:hypothetical protein
MTMLSGRPTKAITPSRHHPEDTDRSRLRVVAVGLLVAMVIALVALGWWKSGQFGSEVSDTPGVDRHVAGLDVLDAYFVRGASPQELTLVGALTITSRGGDRLMGVSAGGGATAALAATTPGAATGEGLPVTSSRLLQIGPEPDATMVSVTGVTRSAGAGSYITTTFEFSRRGSVSMSLPVWDSVLGASGP